MSLGNPFWGLIAILGALGLAIVIALDFTRRRRALDRIGSLPMLKRMTASLSTRRRVLKAVLLVAGITMTLVALARPQTPGQSSWKLRGIDVAVVMDFSKSMMARDIRPSRHTRMVQLSEDLIERLEADRVATVLFSGAAVHFPLSHDHTAATLLYRGVSPLDLAPGSDLGEAMRVARCVLRPEVDAEGGCDRIGGRGRGGDPLTDDQSADELELGQPLGRAPVVADRARAIVIFTDGEDTEGRARAEVDLAASLGIHIFFVGVGTKAGELIPEFDRRGRESGWKKHPDGSFVRTRLNEAELIELATAAGGENRYYHLGAGRFDLDGLASELKRLKKGDLDERVVRSTVPIYQWFLFPAFLLLLIEACVGERRRVR